MDRFRIMATAAILAACLAGGLVPATAQTTEQAAREHDRGLQRYLQREQADQQRHRDTMDRARAEQQYRYQNDQLQQRQARPQRQSSDLLDHGDLLRQEEAPRAQGQTARERDRKDAQLWRAEQRRRDYNDCRDREEHGGAGGQDCTDLPR